MPARKTMPSSHHLSKFPTQQMTILAICRICEPIAFMSIFPYVYFMIEDFGIAKNESEISIYAGMVTSAFTIAEFIAGFAWGKVSDVVGRKPVLMTGLAGTALSMMILGFATHYSTALVARALGGLLNGNMGVLQTTVAEMVTDKKHQPRAYAIMPFVWCLGSVLGPILGGTLARPVANYPSIFVANSIWAKFPYLLPNLICTIVIIFGVITGILFLEETHTVKRLRRDPGLEVGKFIQVKILTWKRRLFNSISREAGHISGSLTFFHDEQYVDYTCASTEPLLEQQRNVKANHCTSRIFTRDIIITISCFGILAYHTMTLDSIMPVFLSFPKPHNQSTWKMPFRYNIGYGLSTKEIGVILSVQGLYSMFATLCIFPPIVRRLGPLRLFRVISILYPVLYISVPYFSLLPPPLNKFGVYLIAIWKCTFSNLAYPSNAIMLTNLAPSFMSLGTINGVAASTASLSRALGPTVSGSLITVGQKIGYSGLTWWSCTAVSLIGAVLSLTLKENFNSSYVDEKNETEASVLSEEIDL